MICSKCNGEVIWKGPLTNLTHTECQACGAINAHVIEEAICTSCEGDADTYTDDGEAICSMCLNWLSGKEP